MSAIREVFEIKDHFTATLRSFNSLGQQVCNSLDSINKKLDEYNAAQNRAASGSNSLITAFKRIAVAAGGVKLAQGFVGLSDEIANTNARLKAFESDSESLAQIHERIFAAAQRSRGDYMAMEASVATLKAQTGDLFGSVAEATYFTELLNKQFAISGTSASGVASTMYNLTQALSTGVLRGNDLQAVLSNSPAIVAKIADYMHVSVGELREMAQKGEVTADVVKNALLKNAKDIEDEFKNMPMTFGQAMQKLKNEGIRALQPLTQAFNDFVNSETFQAAMDGLITAIRVLGQIGAIVFKGLFAAIEWVGQKIGEFRDTLVDAGITVDTVILNIAQAVGTVAGVFFALGTSILNVFSMVANAGITAVEFIINAWNTAVYRIGMAVYNFARGTAQKFNSVISAADGAATAIANAFIRGANLAIGGINGLINALNQIPGVNIGTVGEIGEVSSIISDRIDLSGIKAPTYNGRVSLDRFDTMSMGEAWSSGYDEGYNLVGNAVYNGLNSLVDGVRGLGESVDDGLGGLEIPDYSGGGAGGSGGKANVGTVDKVKDVKLSDEDMKIYRDLAERKYMANVELQTLAPNISVSIPESAAKNLTSEDVANKLKAILIQQAAAHTAVAHAH